MTSQNDITFKRKASGYGAQGLKGHLPMEEQNEEAGNRPWRSFYLAVVGWWRVDCRGVSNRKSQTTGVSEPMNSWFPLRKVTGTGRKRLAGGREFSEVHVSSIIPL